jgi:hypothetical protein
MHDVTGISTGRLFMGFSLELLPRGQLPTVTDAPLVRMHRLRAVSAMFLHWLFLEAVSHALAFRAFGVFFFRGRPLRFSLSGTNPSAR